MTITRAALIGRVTLPAALAAISEAASWLDAHGCTPIVEQQAALAAGIASKWSTAPREALAEQVDVVIAFGGDGTLLDAARAVVLASSETPLVGVNLGRLGFLTEVARTEMLDAFALLLAGSARVETRLMLAGRVSTDGVVTTERLALNDIVVNRGSLSRMIELTVDVDGVFVCHVKADGLIVATATGSTAYNLSAGGPIVHPSVDAVVLTPIAPHTLTHRPLVLPATARIELKPVLEASDVVVTFDGQFGVPLPTKAVVEVGRAPRRLHLLHVSNRTHFDVLREKLKWSNL